jgi:chaperonin GroES
MKETFKPLGDRILIKPDSLGEKKTESGLILTNSAQRGARVYGKVVSVGTGVFSQTGEKIPMTVQVDDIVMYEHDMAGSPIDLDGEKYLLFHEHQLLGILKK